MEASDQSRTTCKSIPGAVCIVDDDDAVLESLVMVFRQNGLRVQGFLDPTELVAAQIDEPACLIVDWHLKNADGLEVLQHCQNRWPHTPALLISGQATIPVAVAAMRRGIGVLEKPVNAGDLIREVTAAIECSKRRRESALQRSNARELLQSLNEGERKVLELVVQGTTNKRAASQLDLSMRTIEKYRASLYEKLGVSSAAEATQIWMFATAESLNEPKS